MMMGNDWGLGWGGMWLGWFMMIGLIVATIVLIVWLIGLSRPGVTTSTGSMDSAHRSESALDILHARYARGEISKDEYLDTRATLLQP